jgi:hypothetical protein
VALSGPAAKYVDALGGPAITAADESSPDGGDPPHSGGRDLSVAALDLVGVGLSPRAMALVMDSSEQARRLTA